MKSTFRYSFQFLITVVVFIFVNSGNEAFAQDWFEIDTTEQDQQRKLIEAKRREIAILMRQAMAENNSNLTNALWDEMRFLLQNTHCLIDKHTCDDTFLFEMFMGYLVLPILFVCVFGNICNFVVYTMEYFQKFVAVKMLAVKAITNTLFVLCFLPKALKTISAWDPIYQQNIENLYWKSWPYVLTAMNTFGTCAMWVTVLMTLERYLYIVCPTRSRQWVTNKNFYLAFIIIFLLSLNLQSVYLITRNVVTTFCSFQSYNKYQFMLRRQEGYLQYEKTYHWLNLSFSIVFPLILLLAMSIVICYRLVYKHSMTTRYSQQKRCINRITFSTTIVHLLLEIPSVVVFAVAAIGGPKMINDMPFMCNWHIFASFLTICNSSVMFFIYMMYSVKFRQMFLIRITCGRHTAPGFLHEDSTLRLAEMPNRSQSATLSTYRRPSTPRRSRPSSMGQPTPHILRDITCLNPRQDVLAERNGSTIQAQLEIVPLVQRSNSPTVPDIVVSCDPP